MKKTIYGSMIACLLAVLFTTNVFAATVATGKPSGFYNNGLFTMFSASVVRIGGKNAPVLTRFDENGTDGSKANMALVNSGQADIGFVQLDAYDQAANKDNVKVIGIVEYEIAHIVVPNDTNKVKELDDLSSSKKYKVNLNMQSGSAVTFTEVGIINKKYAINPIIKDSDNDTLSISAMMTGETDSFFFVSVPGTKTIQRVIESKHFKFGDCWHSSLKDYKVNGKPIYTKVSVGKNDGYPNSFTTFRVPTVVVVNKKFIEQNKNVYDILFDATSLTYKSVKGDKGFKFYPED